MLVLRREDEDEGEHQDEEARWFRADDPFLALSSGRGEGTRAEGGGLPHAPSSFPPLESVFWIPFGFVYSRNIISKNGTLISDAF